MTPSSEDQLIIDAVSDRLKCLDRSHYTYSGMASTQLGSLKKAAVLVPLFVKAGEPHVLLTERAAHLKHGGDVAFPGGMADPGDADEVDTCLREAQEEIGLLPDVVQTVSHLPPRVTRYGVAMYPVVGFIPADFVPKPNEAEVAAVFSLPLSRFLSSERRDSATFTLANSDKIGMFHLFTDTVDERSFKTWGLTANILIELAVGALGRKPDFVYDRYMDITPAQPFAAHQQYMESFLKVPRSLL